MKNFGKVRKVGKWMRKSFCTNMITDSRVITGGGKVRKCTDCTFPLSRLSQWFPWEESENGRVLMISDPWDSDGFTATASRNGAAGHSPTPEPFKLEEPKPVNASPPAGFNPSTPMPWGKHKGQPIQSVPRSYMEWCLKNADSMTSELRQSFEYMMNVLVGSTKPAVDPPKSDPWKAQYQRQGTKTEQPRVAPPVAQIASVRGLVKGWYGKMSRRFHPDLGGSSAQQTVLNACYKSLCEDLDRWEKQ